MIQLNKYLRELGIDEKNWLFNKENKENDDRYNPDEEGFVISREEILFLNLMDLHTYNYIY